MKVTGAMISGLSGSLGGMTAARNRGGTYLRARSIPTNPNSSFQQVVRQFMTQLSVRWRDTLTQPERDSWDNFASNTLIPDSQGEPRNVGGLGMYIKANSIRLQAGLAEIDEASGTPGLVNCSIDPTSMVLDTDTGLTFNTEGFNAWANFTGGVLTAYMSPAVSPARKFYKGPFRYCGKVLGNTSTPPATGINLPLAGLPYPLVLGATYYFRFNSVGSTGRPGPGPIFSVVATSSGGES